MGTMGMLRPHGNNVGTTWGPRGFGDNMGTTLRHGDNMRAMWIQHEDHRDVETTWGQHGDNMGTT